MGVLLWLFSFQVFAFTKGGMLAQHPWLDAGSALAMFTVAAAMLGYSLSLKDDLNYASMLFLIVVASGMLTIRINGQAPYPWYDLMIVMAAPQVFFAAIAFRLGTRRELADLKAVC